MFIYIHDNLQRASVYPIMLSWLPNSKDRESRQGRASVHFILDGFFWLCYFLPVKTKLQDSFDKLCFQTVLNIVVDMSPIGRQIFNAPSVMPQYRVYRFRFSGDSFFNDFKGYQLLIPFSISFLNCFNADNFQ